MKLTNLEEIYQVESLNNPVRDLRVERRKSSIVNFVAEAMRNGERVLVHLEKGAIDVAEKTILQDNANQRNSQPESAKLMKKSCLIAVKMRPLPFLQFQQTKWALCKTNAQIQRYSLPCK